MTTKRKDSDFAKHGTTTPDSYRSDKTQKAKHRKEYV
jgi:hypothetical protein